MSSIVSVNGKTYCLPSGNVSVIGNKAYCDGKLVEDCNDFKEKEITIVVEGDNNSVSLDSGDIIVRGNARDVNGKSGDIEIYGNANNVSTMSGDVEIKGSVYGNVNTVSGDVRTRQIKNKAFEADFEAMCGDNIPRKKRTSWFTDLLNSVLGEN